MKIAVLDRGREQAPEFFAETSKPINVESVLLGESNGPTKEDIDAEELDEFLRD